MSSHSIYFTYYAWCEWLSHTSGYPPLAEILSLKKIKNSNKPCAYSFNIARPVLKRRTKACTSSYSFAGNRTWWTPAMLCFQKTAAMHTLYQHTIKIFMHYTSHRLMKLWQCGDLCLKTAKGMTVSSSVFMRTAAWQHSTREMTNLTK